MAVVVCRSSAGPEVPRECQPGVLPVEARKKLKYVVHPIPGDGAPAVTMIGWHGTALGCRRCA